PGRADLRAPHRLPGRARGPRGRPARGGDGGGTVARLAGPDGPNRREGPRPPAAPPRRRARARRSRSPGAAPAARGRRAERQGGPVRRLGRGAGRVEGEAELPGPWAEARPSGEG